MRCIFALISLAVSLAAAIGCNDNRPTIAARSPTTKAQTVENTTKSAATTLPSKAPPKRESLEVRLENCRKSRLPFFREVAAMMLAEDAAKEGNVEVTKAALTLVANKKSRDDVAARCADIFADSMGMREEAAEVALLIQDEQKRRQTLEKIAKSKGPANFREGRGSGSR